MTNTTMHLESLDGNGSWSNEGFGGDDEACTFATLNDAIAALDSLVAMEPDVWADGSSYRIIDSAGRVVWTREYPEAR